MLHIIVYGISSANRGTIMTHYDIFNILYPLWHYYDTIIAIITFTKVGLLLHIMTKSGITLLFHLWQFHYCHYNFSILLLLLLLLWHYYSHYGYLKNLWHLWQSGFIIVIILMESYYMHSCYYHKNNNSYDSFNSNTISWWYRVGLVWYHIHKSYDIQCTCQPMIS